MARQSIIALRDAIEGAPEMTEEHRQELLTLVDSLAIDLASAESTSEQLRDAIQAAESVVRERGETGEDGSEHDLRERLEELEEKAELVAVEHPVLANALAAIARLI